MRIKLTFFLLYFWSAILFGQNKTTVTAFFDNLNDLEFISAQNVLDQSNIESKHLLRSLLVSIRDVKYNSDNHEASNQKFYADEVVHELMSAYRALFEQNDKALALKHFDKAYKFSKNEDSNAIRYFCVKEILKLYRSKAIQSNYEYRQYLQDLFKEVQNDIQLLSYYSFEFSLLAQTETYNSKVSKNQSSYNAIFKSYDSVADLIKSSNKQLYRYYLDKGNHVIRVNPDLAEQFYFRSFNLLGDESYFDSPKKVLYLNLSRVYQAKEDYKLALENLERAKVFMKESNHLDYFALNTYKSIVFTKMKVLDSALFYEKEARYNQINWDLQKQNVEMSLMQVKLRTAEKEKSLLQTRVWLIGTLVVLVFLTVLSYLLIRYSRRKRLIALQEKEIETQKNLTLLKEQEISTINAMVEGQEKERKRVAEDLHDNLGSVIATLKLHFENLRMNRERKKIDQEQLFDKTENLIDEAYQKVRSIAHAKNAGVIANQGLLFAVKLMAEKISAANTIQIDVIDYGLEKPIENSLEISLFRIIQELTTNIIKHAQAKHATINISQDEDEITILIEDNGIGMNTSQIDLQKGMGLHSIKTRVEHLDGTFTIDSTPTKGTTIIIQIPS